MSLVCNIKTKKEKKLKFPYEDNHKIVNGIEHKLCSDCGEWLSMVDDFYVNKSAPDGHNPYCKKCTKSRSWKWANDNSERFKELKRKYEAENIAKRRLDFRKSSKKRREKGKLLEWQRNNPDKIQQYNAKRRQHKDHDIADQEWFECLEYFNNSCAYCGITEVDALQQYDQLLHKEHVDHNGANDITNCVPACKACNSLKHTINFNEWYNENNPVYSKRRYNKIIKWLLSFAAVKSKEDHNNV